MLTPEQLKQAQACFDWGIANPGPFVITVYPGTEQEQYIANANPGSYENGLEALFRELSLAEYASELWDSEHIWYFSEELFAKKRGKTAYTPWHQDDSVIPSEGEHWLNFWISFEPLPKRNCISIVRGSHRGKKYNGASYRDPDDPTDPLYRDSDLPRLPNIEADLARDPASWDLVSWETQPGDVIVFHPGCLHGGAPVDAGTPERNTLVVRFFGDNAVNKPLPGPAYSGSMEMEENDEAWSHLESRIDGAPFRSPVYPKLR